jgi:hypothetical protein
MKGRDFLLGRDGDPIVRLLASLEEERRPFARPSTVG